MNTVFTSIALLLIIAVTLAASIGYPTDEPPLCIPSYPYQSTGINTATVTIPAIREARLGCNEVGAVNRIIICDIQTFDSCGNIWGQSGNVSEWQVQVVSLYADVPSLLISPVMWLTNGVYRFYFTPIYVGMYQVTVTRTASLNLAPLMTSLPMSVYVSIHDPEIVCSDFMADGAPFATTSFMWAIASKQNGITPIAGLPTSMSNPTSVFFDMAHLYGTGISSLQVPPNQPPFQPIIPPPLGSLPAADNAHYRFCSYLMRSS